jgi:hypothetical protein
MRHRSWIILGLAISLAALIVGCGAKKEAAQTATDSTAFATNPTEQGQGDITPQGQVPPPPPEATNEPQAERRPAPRTQAPAPRTQAPATPAPAGSPGITVPSGTQVAITLNTKLNSETAQVGDAWTGVVKDNVVVGEKTVIPAGSVVSGTVSAVKPAEKGDRAMLDLAVDGLTVEGSQYRVHATTEAIVAGSTRARNIGAVAGGAAAGALIGRAVGGSGKGALIGGLLGGAAAGGAVAKSKGYQVELKEGTQLTFTTSEAVAIKR